MSKAAWKTKGKNLYQHFCEDCKRIFYSFSAKSKRCDSCNYKFKLVYSREWQKRARRGETNHYAVHGLPEGVAFEFTGGKWYWRYKDTKLNNGPFNTITEARKDARTAF